MSEKDKRFENLPESKEKLEENWYPTSSGGSSNNSGSSDKELAKQKWDEFGKTLKNS